MSDPGGDGRNRRRHQGHGAVGTGNGPGGLRHGQGLQGCQGLGRRGEALAGVAGEQAGQGRLQIRLVAEAGGPAPRQRAGLQQAGRRIAAEQHQGRDAQGMEVHPGLGPLTAGALRRGVAGGHGIATHHQAEVQQHRQAITVPAEQVGGAEIAMHQLLAVQGGQHRQQLAQQQEHLAGAEHHLALGPGLEQLLQGAAGLPLAHQPEAAVLAQGPSEPGHLGVQHPLQPGPEFPGPMLVQVRAQLAQHHRRSGGQLVGGAPEGSLGPLGEWLLQPVSLADQQTALTGLAVDRGMTRSGGHQPAVSEERSGCRRPFPSSQSRS